MVFRFKNRMIRNLADEPSREELVALVALVAAQAAEIAALKARLAEFERRLLRGHDINCTKTA